MRSIAAMTCSRTVRSEAYSRPASSWIGRASMSARARTVEDVGTGEDGGALGIGTVIVVDAREDTRPGDARGLQAQRGELLLDPVRRR